MATTYCPAHSRFYDHDDGCPECECDAWRSEDDDATDDPVVVRVERVQSGVRLSTDGA